MTGWQPQPSSIGPHGEYAGRAETFIISNAQHACESARVYQFNGRPCEPWERVVLDRAYDQLLARDIATITVGK